MKILNETNSKLVAVDKLKPHPQNPNRGDSEAIAESIAVNGFYGVVVVQKSTGFVLAGNHRLEAAKAEGADKVPVIYVDVDDTAALKILLADNKSSEMSYRDADALTNILDTLKQSDDLLGTLYSPTDYGALTQDLMSEIEPIDLSGIETPESLDDVKVTLRVQVASYDIDQARETVENALQTADIEYALT